MGRRAGSCCGRFSWVLMRGLRACIGPADNQGASPPSLLLAGRAWAMACAGIGYALHSVGQYNQRSAQTRPKFPAQQAQHRAKLPPILCACSQLHVPILLQGQPAMRSPCPWQRLSFLHAAGPSTALPRRSLASRALATNAAVVQRLLEGRPWLMHDPAVPVSSGGGCGVGRGRPFSLANRAFDHHVRIALLHPAQQVTHVQPEGCAGGFAVIRDDLTHPLIGGNKWRKLDGLWPQLDKVRGPGV